MVECHIWIRAAYKKDKRRLLTAYFLVRLAGLEPAAYGLEVRCSIQLSYRRTKNKEINNTQDCLCRF